MMLTDDRNVGVLAAWDHQTYDADKSRVRSTSLKSILGPHGPRDYFLRYVDKKSPVYDGDHDAVNYLMPGMTQGKVDSKVIGQLLHYWVLEEQKPWFKCPHKRNSAGWSSAVRDSGGLWALKPQEVVHLTGMYDGLLRNKEIRELLEQRHFKEETILWEHHTGVEAKARLDMVDFRQVIYDLKTTRHATRSKFDRQLRELQYEFSAAFYYMARNSIPDWQDCRAPFKHIVVSSVPPHYAWMSPLDLSYLQVGHRNVEKAFKLFKECMLRHATFAAGIGGQPVIEAWPDNEEQDQQYPISAPTYYLSQSGFNDNDFDPAGY